MNLKIKFRDLFAVVFNFIRVEKNNYLLIKISKKTS